MKKNRTKLLIISLLIILIILSRIFKINELVSANGVLSNLDKFREIVNSSLILYSMIFILAYALIVALALPIAAIMSLSAGLVLGVKLGVILVVIGATLGAVANFVLTRYLFGEYLQNKYSEKLLKINRELESSGSNYLLMLRLIPLFPFFLINIAAGLSNISIRTFIWTTGVGIIPGTFAYVYLGTSINSFSDGGGLPIDVVIALIIIGIMTLLPVIYKKIKR